MPRKTALVTAGGAGIGEATSREAKKLQTVTIPAGSVGGQRVSFTGLRGGAPLLRFRSNWFVTTKLDPELDLRGDGWRVVLDGDTAP